jgi:hypothetical protein
MKDEVTQIPVSESGSDDGDEGLVTKDNGTAESGEPAELRYAGDTPNRPHCCGGVLAGSCV